MKCIICREEKQEMSDEHVIPDSLSGFYHIYNVCKDCNSKMGSKVDSPLINHKLTELYRFCQDIEGKSGKVPNPFSGVFFDEENPEAKARVDVTSDGKLDVVYYPVIRVHEHNGTIQSIEIEVDTKNEGRIDDILSKILKRKGLPDSAVVKSERRRELRTGGMGGKWEIDILEFKIGLLKIAYEFAVDSIDDYFLDEDAIKISNILKNADYEGAKAYVKIGSGLQHEIFDPFIDYLDLASKKHYLVLTQIKKELVCFIKLHGIFSIGVALSKNTFLTFDKTIFGINDIEKKLFKKIKIIDVINQCTGPLHTRFCYYFENDADAIIGQSEINSPGFHYEENGNGVIPLYKRNGERYPFFVHEMLPQCHYESRKDGVWNIELFKFDSSHEYFIKSEKFNKLYRVVALEMSRERIHRI